MKSAKLFTLLPIIILLITSCNEFLDSLKLPGENPEDIVLYELDNSYLAPESRSFIAQEYPSNEVENAYILIGKNTYGFEANLDNNKHLSFDEDGSLKNVLNHPFNKEKYKNGKRNKGKRDHGKDKEKDHLREKCFEVVFPYDILMPDSTVLTIDSYEDKSKIESWYKNNPDVKEKPSRIFPFKIIIKNDDGNEEIILLNNEDELKSIISECNSNKNKKDRCRKLSDFELPDCIRDFLHENYSSNKILHSRKIKLLDGEYIFIVKLAEVGILKFDEDCLLID